ncbi:MAG: SDR family oxidoreductase [Actinomycetota bacterium]|nr:SDR family oxidoreductase [Actinomycetota bacterium]
MMEDGRVALVSGANRGIGREIVRQLAGTGITTILGSRDEEKGRAAAEEIDGDVRVRQLDVTDEKGIQNLARDAEEEFGRLDILVNNAGVSIDGGQRGVDADLDVMWETLEMNLFGAWRLCEAFVPLMQRNGYGRIVNVSSGMGALNDMGGGSPAYRVSKTSLNALTRILASELRGTGILVNSVCPGWVQTDMGGSGASRAVEEGVDTPVWAATLPNNGPTGGFFRDRRQIPW